LPVGSKLGKYEVVQCLAVGGEAIVYRAHDPFLDRCVAIKQIAPHLARDETYCRRYREIMRRLARLRCEEVVVIHELIEDDRGVFVVMEFVEGHTIASTLANQDEPVEPKAVLQILWRVAAGLAEVHRAGIVHRDIKPGNLIVGEGLRVKITDFGVAAPAGVPASVRWGTARYMAPDLMTGVQVDARADIYSLGMVAYEMLLGRGRFNEVFADIVRDSSPEVERGRWMKWHTDPDKTAPPLHELNPAVPEALSRIVAKMLAKDPEDRFRNVEQLGREIRANFSTRATRDARRGERKRRVLLAAAGAAEAAGEGADLGAAPPEGAPEPTDEPRTAAIPKKPISRKAKLIAAGALAAGLLAILVVNSVNQSIRVGKLTAEARGLYGQAERTYTQACKSRSTVERKELFGKALAAYRKVGEASPYKDLPLGAWARVRQEMCRSHLHVLDGDFDAMFKTRDAADRMLARLADRGAGQDSVRRFRGEQDAFGRYWRNQRQYVQGVAEAQAAIEEGKLDKAKRILADGVGRNLAEEQKARIAAMKVDIETKEKEVAYWDLIHKGEKLEAGNQVTEAVAAYDHAASVLDLKNLDAKTYNDLKTGAIDHKNILLARTDYLKSVREAKRLAKRDRLGAAKAYRQAATVFDQAKEKISVRGREALLAIADPAKLAEQAIDLEHDHWLLEGRSDLAAGRISDAERALNKAKALKNSAAVQAELNKIQRQRDFDNLVRAGDSLFRQRNYAGALEQYQQAMKLPSRNRAAVQAKMGDCQYFIEFNKALGYQAKGEWDKAEHSLRNARRFKPANSAQIDAMITQLQQKRAFRRYMSEAELAFRKQDWTQALKLLDEAKKVDPTSQEVDLKIKDVRYEQYYQMGLAAIDQGDLRAALSYFKLARNAKTTTELEQLIEQTEQGLKKGEGNS